MNDRSTKCDLCNKNGSRKKCHISYKNKKCKEICFNCGKTYIKDEIGCEKDGIFCTIEGETFRIGGDKLETGNVILYTSPEIFDDDSPVNLQ
jgi:hypothetical protein